MAIRLLVNKLNIIAITVVGSNCSQNPKIIKKKIEYDLIDVLKTKNIEVYAGADRPYIDYQKELKDEDIFPSYNYKPTDYSMIEKIVSEEVDIQKRLSNIAAVKITELSKKYGDKLNVLSLGPLTNVSLAVLLDNTLRDKVTLYITGGSYNNLGNSGNAAEYNFRADPIAAKNVIFYYKKVNLIPLELEDQIIEKIKWSSIHSTKWEFKDYLELMINLSQASEQSRSRYSFLGLLAALIILNPTIIKNSKVLPVEVDIIGRFTRGALIIEKYEHLKSGKLSDIEIFEEIDLESFKNELNNYI